MPNSIESQLNRAAQTVPLGAKRASNRLSLAPLTNCQSEPDGTAGADEINWLRSRARSGFGTVVTSALAVHSTGRTWDRQAAIYDDRFLPGLQKLAACRSVDTVMLAQLFHGGRRADRGLMAQPWGPSAGEGVEQADPAMIETLAAAFVDAASRATTAGFDGIEIHAAHGYLPAQFLSQEENQRSDVWGGTLENRARFLLDIVRRIRESEPQIVLQVRLSAEDMRQSRGIDLDETAEIANLAVAAGADSISLSVWDLSQPSQKYPTVSATTFVRERLDAGVPLTAAGKVWDAHDLASALEQGADQIALGRVAIFNPAVATEILQPEWSPTRPPLSRQQLHQLDVRDGFVDYLSTKWPDFIA